MRYNSLGGEPIKKRRNYRELPDLELPPEIDAKVRAMTAVADQQIDEVRDERHRVQRPGGTGSRESGDITGL